MEPDGIINISKLEFFSQKTCNADWEVLKGMFGTEGLLKTDPSI